MATQARADPPKAIAILLQQSTAATSLKRLVATAKSRWPIEHSFRELKDELGLDQFKGRSWRGWHHHVVLVLVAYAYLQFLRRRPSKKGAARRCHGCAADSSDSSPAGAVAVLSATDRPELAQLQPP